MKFMEVTLCFLNNYMQNNILTYLQYLHTELIIQNQTLKNDVRKEIEE